MANGMLTLEELKNEVATGSIDTVIACGKIAEGAVRLNDEAVSDPALTVAVGDEPVKLSLGKKRHALLVR